MLKKISLLVIITAVLGIVVLSKIPSKHSDIATPVTAESEQVDSSRPSVGESNEPPDSSEQQSIVPSNQGQVAADTLSAEHPVTNASPLTVPAVNLEYRALSIPNDYQAQWHTDRVQAPATWSKTVGSPDTVMAVLDSGFALEHDDLFDRWAHNTGEIGDGRESNGLDDDQNGYVDDWQGWDFVQYDNQPQAGTSDPNGESVWHGSSVAGLAAATGNNSLGGAGVNWRTRIMPLQVLTDDGVGYSSTIGAAIRYAADNGADVINLSLGTATNDVFVQDAVDYAISRGALIVAAAGNDGCDCLLYPARYEPVIAVGSTDSQNTISDFSSYGANLDLVAPGDAIPAAPAWQMNNPQNDYIEGLYGTSFSAPLVSGAATLLKGVNGALSAAQLTSILKDTAMPLSAQPPRYGAGLLNISAAIAAASSSLPVTTPLRTVPLFVLFAPGQADVVTAEPDKKANYTQRGYSYRIERFVAQ